MSVWRVRDRERERDLDLDRIMFFSRQVTRLTPAGDAR